MFLNFLNICVNKWLWSDFNNCQTKIGSLWYLRGATFNEFFKTNYLKENQI